MIKLILWCLFLSSGCGKKVREREKVKEKTRERVIKKERKRGRKKRKKRRKTGTS